MGVLPMHKNQQDDSVNSKNHRKEQHTLKQDKIPFAQVPIALIKDNRLSHTARLVFCYMATKPDTWQFYNADIANSLEIYDKGVTKALKQLEACGWVSSYQKREDGKFKGKIYTLHYSTDRLITDGGKTDGGKTDGGNAPLLSNINLSNKDCSNNESDGGLQPMPSALDSSNSDEAKKEPQADKDTASPCPLGGRQTTTENEEQEDELTYDSGCNNIDTSMTLMYTVVHAILEKNDYILSRTVSSFCGLFSPPILRLPKQKCDDMLDQFAHSLHYSNYLITDVLKVVEYRFKERVYNDFYVRDFLAALMTVLDNGKNYGLKKQA